MPSRISPKTDSASATTQPPAKKFIFPNLVDFDRGIDPHNPTSLMNKLRNRMLTKFIEAFYSRRTTYVSWIIWSNAIGERPVQNAIMNEYEDHE